MARITLRAMARLPGRAPGAVHSLLDARGEPPVPLPAGARWRPSAGSRGHFLAGIVMQAWRRPRATVFDHLDLAQCQLFLPRPLRRPFALWVHGIEVWKALPPRKARALAAADVLLFNSEFTRRRFATYHGEPRRSVVVPLTVPPLTLPPAPHPPPGRAILTVGRLEPHRPKGHRQILAVLPRVAAAVPDVHWHIAGTGSDLEPLRSEVAASPCCDRITVHGFLPAERMEALWADCRVFAMPSEGEGFGVVYLEAMQRGLLPVGSTMDAAPEVIGDAGLCVDHLARPEDLADAIIRLLTLSDAEAEARRAAAMARAAVFSEDRFAAALAEGLGCLTPACP